MPDGSVRYDAEYRATLRQIAEATSLTQRDASFALKEIGFLKEHILTNETKQSIISVTYKMVVQVAEARKIREPRFNPHYSLLSM